MTLGTFRRAVGSQGASTTPQAAITIPTTGTNAVVPTDTCLLICLGGTDSAAPDGTWTTVKANTVINAGASRCGIYRKVIGSDTTITPAWPTAPASGNNTAHLALFFTGVNGTEAVGSATSPSGTASAATVCTGTTTQGADRMVLAIALSKGASGGFPSSVSWSGGFTGIASQMATGTFFPSIAVAKLDKPTQGGTTDQTATWDYSTLNQLGLQLAMVPSVVGLTIAADVTPASGGGPLDVTLTLTSTGGNGNAKTYSVDWGDGTTSPGQTSNVFTHQYASVSSQTVRNANATVSQA